MAIFMLSLLMLVALFALLVLVLRLVRPLPSLQNRTASQAIAPDSGARLGRIMASLGPCTDKKSAVVMFRSGDEAFTARMRLIELADHAIDMQYYIWHSDLTGFLLLRHLHDAAERGVRVRMLLDDNGIQGLDTVLAALNTHPNIEIRLFNPFVIRSSRLWGYLTDPIRLNRRMHNKSMTVDSIAAIVGGRNIGNEYFDAAESGDYIDMDVLALGEAACDVAQNFDKYWASDSAYPAERILSVSKDYTVSSFVAQTDAQIKTAHAAEYVQSVRVSTLLEDIFSGLRPVEWAQVTLISDDPVKGLGRASTSELLLSSLVAHIARDIKSFDLISAYFVPGPQGTRILSTLARRGVAVRALTNSLAATDVILVHAGYTAYRRHMLHGGIALYELKRDHRTPVAANRASGAQDDTMFKVSKRQERKRKRGFSASALHAKVISMDRTRIFVGSFNFDPRSARLNCEMGFLIESTFLAEDVSGWLDQRLEGACYRPVINPHNKRMVWEDSQIGGAQALTREPGHTFKKSVIIFVARHLPIEWLL